MLGRGRFMTSSPEGTNERAVGWRGQTRARRLLGELHVEHGGVNVGVSH